jgi:hypothetical protein
MPRKKKSSRVKFLSPAHVGSALLIAAVVFIALEATNTINVFRKPPLANKAVIITTPTASNKTSQTPSQSTSNQSTTNSTTTTTPPTTTSSTSTGTGSGSGSTKSTLPANSASTTSSSSTSGSAAPVDPSGDFVSNHTPDLSGSPYPSQEISVCNTTPGASCTITFTMGSTVRTLAAQVADANGSTSWTWNVTQDNGSSGFAQGDWQITATATLNGQTASTTDNRALDVGP